MRAPYCRIWRVRAARVLVAVVVCLAPAAAQAGRTQYGWLFGTEVMPERGAELQTWITEENKTNGNDYHETLWGMQALIGVNDQIELAFPVEFTWRDSADI